MSNSAGNWFHVICAEMATNILFRDGMNVIPYLLHSFQIVGISIPTTTDQSRLFIEKSTILTILPTSQAEIISASSQLSIPTRCSICNRLITKQFVRCRYASHLLLHLNS